MKKSVTEFARDIRNQYPQQYDNLQDNELIDLWLKRFPNDKNLIDFSIVDHNQSLPLVSPFQQNNLNQSSFQNPQSGSQNQQQSFNNHNSDPNNLNPNGLTNIQNDRLGTMGSIVSFILPLVGFIIYFSQKNEKPKRASSAARSAFWGIGTSVVVTLLIVVIGIVFMSSNYAQLDDYGSNTALSNTNDTIDSSISQDPEISDERQLEIMTNKDYYNYNCRECGNQIKWVGSYHWTHEDDSDNSIITEITDLSLNGDDRINTEMYHEEGHSNRGLFCSRICANNNLQEFLYP